jgi:hypothetical protein
MVHSQELPSTTLIMIFPELVPHLEIEFFDFFGDYRMKYSKGCLNQKINSTGGKQKGTASRLSNTGAGNVSQKEKGG